MQLCKQLIIFCLLFAVPAVSAEIRLRPLYQENIDQHEQRIATELKRINYLRYGIATALTLSAGYFTYRLFAGSPEPKPGSSVDSKPQELTPELITEIKKGFAENRITNQNLTLFLANHGYCVPNQTISWGQWGYGWANWFGTQAFVIFVGYIISNSMNPFMKYFNAFDAKVDALINRIYFTPTVAWFLATRCPLTQLFTQLETDAAELQSRTDVDHARDSFIMHWTICSQQIEALLGFMQYQSRINENAEITQRKKSITGFIPAEIEKQQQVIEHALAVCDNTLFTLVNQLRVKLNQHINEFSLLESLSLY